MQNVKIGEIYRVKKDSREKCGNFRDKKTAEFIKVTKIDSDGDIHYVILDKEKNAVGGCEYCLKPSDLLPLKKTLQDIEIGDVVVDRDGNEFAALEVFTQLCMLSYSDNHDSVGAIRTFKELESNGYTIKDQESEIKELTMDEIAEKFDIPVDRLKIKKQ